MCVPREGRGGSWRGCAARRALSRQERDAAIAVNLLGAQISFTAADLIIYIFEEEDFFFFFFFGHAAWLVGSQFHPHHLGSPRPAKPALPRPGGPALGPPCDASNASQQAGAAPPQQSPSLLCTDAEPSVPGNQSMSNPNEVEKLAALTRLQLRHHGEKKRDSSLQFSQASASPGISRL